MLKQIVFILLALCLGLTACAGGRQQKGGTAQNAPGNAALEKVKSETVQTKGEAAMGKEHVGNVLSIKLNSGYAMPVLGLGTWSQNNQTAAESVYTALKLGYRLIDTARYYGNERGVGEGVKRAIAEGIIKREEVFITSKIMPGNYDNAAAAIDASLKDLGVAYLDLMLIHQQGRVPGNGAGSKEREDSFHWHFQLLYETAGGRSPFLCKNCSGCDSE